MYKDKELIFWTDNKFSGLDIRSVAKKELSNQLSDIDSLSDEEINKRMQTLFSVSYVINIKYDIKYNCDFF